MSFDRVKNTVACLAGAGAATAFGWWIYTGVVTSSWSLGFGLTALLDAVEALSWSKVALGLAMATLFLECAIVKKIRAKEPSESLGMALAATGGLSLVFFALCAMSNDGLIKGSAVAFMLAAWIASLVIFAREIEVAENRALKRPHASLANRALVGAGALALAAGLAAAFDWGTSMSSGVARVAAKHEAQVKALGFTGFHQTDDHWRGNYIVLEESRGLHVLDGMLLTRENVLDALEIAEEDRENFSNAFSGLELDMSGGRLVISGLKYDKERLSQEELARQLDLVMTRSIVPDLIKMRETLNERARNKASHGN